MDLFDLRVLKAFFVFVQWCPAVDGWLRYVANDNFVKGAVFLAFFWWLWFSNHRPVDQTREILVFAFVASSLALLLGRIVALYAPFRVRPLQNPRYELPFPPTAPSDIPHSWNSFPSDHAILFFCLAGCLWIASRRVGILALFHTLFVVCIPRIYMGYHYPLDIIAGAFLGIGLAAVGKCARIRKSVTRPAFLWIERHPASFYAFSFLWTFEVAELFRTLLNLQRFIRYCAATYLKSNI